MLILLLTTSGYYTHIFGQETNKTEITDIYKLQTQYNKVAASIGRKNFLQAVKQATAIIEIAPNYREAYRARAYANFELNNLKQAEKDIRQFHKLLGTDRYDIFVLLGRIQIAQTNYPAAISSFRKVEELKPHTPGINLSLAKLYYKTGNYSIAKQYLRKAASTGTPEAKRFAGNVLKEISVAESRQNNSRKYLLEAENAIRADDIPKALQKLELWASTVTNKQQITEMHKTKIFELLYNRAQYKEMMHDLNSKINNGNLDKSQEGN